MNDINNSGLNGFKARFITRDLSGNMCSRVRISVCHFSCHFIVSVIKSYMSPKDDVKLDQNLISIRVTVLKFS